MDKILQLGLIVNPLAGLGGSLGLKGSDGPEIRKLASEQGKDGQNPPTRAEQRTGRALECLSSVAEKIHMLTWAGHMGESVLKGSGFTFDTLGECNSDISSADDTRLAAEALYRAGADLILFSGGDGTARDIYDAIGRSCPVLGIPAGVKMHSGVFAVSPEAAGAVIHKLCVGGLVRLGRAEVRDIDEAAFRLDTVRAKFYGEMMVPAEGQFMQHTKVGGREDQALVATEIAAWVVESMETDRLYILGPGSTTAAIAEELGIAPTLLGVDVVHRGKLLASDADEAELLSLLENGCKATIVVTAIGGQGHIFGRGNQQLSPDVIRTVGKDNIMLVAAKSKITDLEGRPLLVDCNDASLDAELEGYWPVTTGYDDQIMYRVGKPWED